MCVRTLVHRCEIPNWIKTHTHTLRGQAYTHTQTHMSKFQEQHVQKEQSHNQMIHEQTLLSPSGAAPVGDRASPLAVQDLQRTIGSAALVEKT